MNKHLIRLALVLGVLGMASSAYGQSAGLSATTSAKPPRFYGLSFDFTVADGSGLNAVGQNYRNDLNFYFEPTWNFGRLYLSNIKPLRNMHLAARFIVTQNLAGVDETNRTGTINTGPQGTCSDVGIMNGVVDPTTVGYCNPPGADRRTDYSDLWLTLRAPRIYTIPKVDIGINPQIRLIVPTSLQSRNAHLASTLTAFLGFGRAFFKGRLRLGYSFGFQKFFHTQTTQSFGQTGNASTIAPGGNPWNAVTSTGSANFYSDPSRNGQVNTNFSLMNIVSGGVQIHEKVSFDLLYFTIHGFAYDQSCVIVVNGVPEDICQNGDAVAANSGSRLDRPGLRQSQVLWGSLSYHALDWLTVTLSWINFAPMFNPDSTYRQGIFSADYNAFTTVMLGTTVSIDQFAAKFIKQKQN